jgi:hypothetical protein
MWLFYRPHGFVLVITPVSEGPRYDIHRCVAWKSLWRCSVEGFLRIWSLSPRVHSTTRETHPPNIKPQLMYVSSIWPLRHVFLEQSDTALEGITEITEHKKAEVTLAWRTHGIGS